MAAQDFARLFGRHAVGEALADRADIRVLQRCPVGRATDEASHADDQTQAGHGWGDPGGGVHAADGPYAAGFGRGHQKLTATTRTKLWGGSLLKSTGTMGDDPLSWCGKRRSGTTGRAPYGRELNLWCAGTSRGTRCCRRCGTRCEVVDRAYRLLAGCISVAGLALQFWLMAHYPSSKSLLTTATHFFSFFTIQTNVLIAASMLVPAIMPGTRLSQLFSNASIRTAILAYTLLTALVYFALLRNIGHDDGLERRADQILHYVSSALFFFDWLAFGAKGQVPFVRNAKRLDLWHLATNFMGLVFVALVIPYALVALDRLLTTVRRQRA